MARCRSFDLGNGRQGALLFAAATGKGGRRPGVPVAGIDPAGAGIGVAQLRRQTGSGAERPRAGELEADGAAQGRDSLCGGAHRVAGLHRRAVAGGPGGDAVRPGAAGQESQADRAAGAGGSGGGPLGAGGLLRHAGCPEPEPGPGVQAQPRALRVPQMGHASLRDVQGGAAGHRHRAPGKPGIPRQGCLVVLHQLSTINHQLSSTPTRWWGRIRTRR